MSNILKVSTPTTGYENSVRNNPASQGENLQIQNPVDPGRVVRPDGRTDAGGQQGTKLGMRYESNFGTFVQMLKESPQLTEIMSRLMFGGMINLVEAGIGKDTAEEISAFFQMMKMSEEELVAFLKDQTKAAVGFQGPFFTLMRQALTSAPTVEQRTAILELLKRYTDMASGKHLMETIKGNLEGMKHYMFRGDREEFEQLIGGLEHRAPQDTAKNAARLRQEIIPYLSKYISRTRDMGRLRDLISQLSFNTARYENGDLDQLIRDFKSLMGFPSFRKIFQGLDEEQLRNLLMNLNFEKAAGRSEWADTFLHIVESGIRGEAGAENRQIFENMIQSILLNESVFMPVLHIMLPVELNGQLMFSELWIDPDEEGRGAADPKERTIRLLIKFDIKDVGFFDLLMVCEKETVNLRLFYPEQLAPLETELKKGVGEILERNRLRCQYLGLEKSRGSIPVSSVFPKIYERKNTVNVAI